MTLRKRLRCSFAPFVNTGACPERSRRVWLAFRCLPATAYWRLLSNHGDVGVRGIDGDPPMTRFFAAGNCEQLVCHHNSCKYFGNLSESARPCPPLRLRPYPPAMKLNI